MKTQDAHEMELRLWQGRDPYARREWQPRVAHFSCLQSIMDLPDWHCWESERRKEGICSFPFLLPQNVDLEMTSSYTTRRHEGETEKEKKRSPRGKFYTPKLRRVELRMVELRKKERWDSKEEYAVSWGPTSFFPSLPCMSVCHFIYLTSHIISVSEACVIVVSSCTVYCFRSLKQETVGREGKRR